MASRKAVKHTAYLFVKSVEHALPSAKVSVVTSDRPWGYSRYIYLRLPNLMRPIKVRVSDHEIGMRRAISGECDLYIRGGAKPDSWSVWIGDMVRMYGHVHEGAV